MLRRLCLVLGSVTLALVPNPALSQTDTTVSYDAKALRVEAHFGEFRIVRGLNGPVVGKIGAFSRVDLTKLVQPSENAVKEAHEFNRNQGPGMLATTIGGLALGVTLIASRNSDPNWGLISAEIGASALALYGGIVLNRAYGALSRSIWWYNRDLKR